MSPEDDFPVEIMIRDYNSELDDPYIYSTWTRYCWYSPEARIETPKQEWFREKTKYIKSILSGDSVKIACFKGNPYVIAGYIVVHQGKIEWLCIKKDLMHEGIQNLLMESMKGRMNGTEERAEDRSEERRTGEGLLGVSHPEGSKPSKDD